MLRTFDGIVMLLSSVIEKARSPIDSSDVGKFIPVKDKHPKNAKSLQRFKEYCGEEYEL